MVIVKLYRESWRDMAADEIVPDRGTPYFERLVRKVDENGWRDERDLVVKEKALTIYVNNEELATVVCSPMYLEYMALGFLCAEGILRKRDDLKDIAIDEEQGLAYVETNRSTRNISEKMFLKRYINPCCGRGRASFYFSNDALLCKAVTAENKVARSEVSAMVEALQNRSRLFRRTGGVHNAALAEDGRIIIFQEDIGRHNTLDKIFGQCFCEEIALRDKVIVFSGRVSSEILLKIAKMGAPILVSRSAPTDLALELADDLGITVIGFARGQRFSVYSHPERVAY